MKPCLLSDWRIWKILCLKDCIAQPVSIPMPIVLTICSAVRDVCTLKWLCSPIKAFYEGRLLPVGLPHQLEDSGNINRLSFILRSPNRWVLLLKQTIRKQNCCPSGRNCSIKNTPEAFDASRTLGIITPYRSQIALIKKEIEVLGIPELNQILIDTVERFQGKWTRCDYFYSFCVNYPYQLKFLSNLTEEDGILIDRKLNVALTRAKKTDAADRCADAVGA